MNTNPDYLYSNYINIKIVLLRMEMSCRKKYYSLLDEYRREREKFSQPLTKQNNERMAQDILTLAEEDVIRRKVFRLYIYCIVFSIYNYISNLYIFQKSYSYVGVL